MLVVPALAAVYLTGCAKDINNKEAVRTAVVDYLSKRSESTGLNVANMDVQVASMSFQKDQAQVVVSIKPKGSPEGMQMSYALVRKGDAWEVKSKQESGANPHGGTPPSSMPPPSGGGATPMGDLPPGHPATGGGASK